MATKPKSLALKPNQAQIAADLLRQYMAQWQRRQQYRAMLNDSRRTDGTQPPAIVRFVDQESHREVLDVPVQQLIDAATLKMQGLNGELAQWCGITIKEE